MPHHQAVKQGADDVDIKWIGNLCEIAFEQFCQEYPGSMWEWKNREAVRRCNPESFAGYFCSMTSRQVAVFESPPDIDSGIYNLRAVPIPDKPIDWAHHVATKHGLRLSTSAREYIEA